jgi:hypothetical protein
MSEKESLATASRYARETFREMVEVRIAAEKKAVHQKFKGANKSAKAAAVRDKAQKQATKAAWSGDSENKLEAVADIQKRQGEITKRNKEYGEERRLASERVIKALSSGNEAEAEKAVSNYENVLAEGVEIGREVAKLTVDAMSQIPDVAESNPEEAARLAKANADWERQLRKENLSILMRDVKNGSSLAGNHGALDTRVREAIAENSRQHAENSSIVVAGFEANRESLEGEFIPKEAFEYFEETANGNQEDGETYTGQFEEVNDSINNPGPTGGAAGGGTGGGAGGSQNQSTAGGGGSGSGNSRANPNSNSGGGSGGAAGGGSGGAAGGGSGGAAGGGSGGAAGGGSGGAAGGANNTATSQTHSNIKCISSVGSFIAKSTSGIMRDGYKAGNKALNYVAKSQSVYSKN